MAVGFHSLSSIHHDRNGKIYLEDYSLGTKYLKEHLLLYESAWSVLNILKGHFLAIPLGRCQLERMSFLCVRGLIWDTPARDVAL